MLFNSHYVVLVNIRRQVYYAHCKTPKHRGAYFKMIMRLDASVRIEQVVAERMRTDFGF